MVASRLVWMDFPVVCGLSSSSVMSMFELPRVLSNVGIRCAEFTMVNLCCSMELSFSPFAFVSWLCHMVELVFASRHKIVSRP